MHLFTYSYLGNDTYLYNVTARDFSNNENTSATRVIYIDQVLPVIQFIPTTLSNGSIINQRFIIINVSILNEQNVDNITITVGNSTMVNSTAYSTTNTTFTYNFSGVSNTTYEYNVTVRDRANNVNTSHTRFITLDFNIPSVTLDSPTDNYALSVASVNTTCTANDNTQLSNITLFTNLTNSFVANRTSNVSGTSSSTTFNLTGVPDGRYLWNCRAFDNTSLSAFAPFNNTFIVDTAVPSASVTASPTSITTTGSSTITCSGTDNIQVSTATATASTGSICSASGSTCSGTFSTTTAGSYTITCTVDDLVAHTATATTTVTVTAPGGGGGGGSA